MTTIRVKQSAVKIFKQCLSNLQSMHLSIFWRQPVSMLTAYSVAGGKLPRPNIRTTALGVMKFTILVDPSLVTITLYLVCLIYALE